MTEKILEIWAGLVATMANIVGVAHLLVVLGGVGMVLASFYLKPIRTWRQFFNWVLVFAIVIMVCVGAFYFLTRGEA